MTTFKKMRSLMAILALVMCVALAFASCGPKAPAEEPACECVDANSDHKCDICGNALTECSNENGDHNCDVCDKALSECADGNADHKCDVCGAVASDCADADKDHYCDVCNKPLGDCVDADKDHKCDVCGIINSSCYDGDKDHVCNHCGGNVGGECADGDDEDHNCDYCGKSLCVDEDKNDYCDVCGKCYCVDENADCTCDFCGANLCTDVNPIDHYCDVCGKLFSECADGEDGNHDCDICYKSLCADGADEGCDCDVCGASLCVDADNNHACDNCAKTLCYDTTDPGHNCDVCGKNLCVDGDSDEDHICDVCGDILCYDTDSNLQCEVCGNIVPAIIVYANGVNCKVNGADILYFVGNEGDIVVVPSYLASEYVIDFWQVFDGNNNLIAVIENGDAFLPTANGKYYISPVFIANNLSGITDGNVTLDVSDSDKVSDDNLNTSWADVPVTDKIVVAGPAKGPLGKTKNHQFYIAVDPYDAANTVLISANSSNNNGGSNAIIEVELDKDDCYGDGFVLTFDYLLDYSYCNSGACNYIGVKDADGNKIVIANIEQRTKAFANGNNGAATPDAFLFLCRTAENKKPTVWASLASDTWYTFKVEVIYDKVSTYWSLRGSDEWTLIDTQDFSSKSISSLNIVSAYFEAGYWNNTSISYLDNFSFDKRHDCVDADNSHYCDVCNVALCYDGIDADHNCDRCDANLCADGDIADHYCDCGAKLSECADEDKTHYCDICGIGGFGGECADGDDEGHDCDYCGKNLCADNDFNHICDVCAAVLSECADTDKNHNCDYCGAVLSACADENKDHACDTCKANMGEHADATGDGDHVCDYGCGATISEHVDAEPDFVCDECASALCNDSDANHKCDITSEHECVWVVTDHVDADKNHVCDFAGCDEAMGEHADAADDEDHACDYGCGAIIGECADNDKNHICEVCGKFASYCADANADHVCDVCGKADVCTDADKNTFCDNCGKYVAYNFETDSMSSVSGVIDIMHSQSAINKPTATSDNIYSNSINTTPVDSAHKYGVHYSLSADPIDAANQVLHVHCQAVGGGGANIPAAMLLTPTTVDEGGALLVLQVDVLLSSCTDKKNGLHLTAVTDSTYVNTAGTAPSTGYQRVSINRWGSNAILVGGANTGVNLGEAWIRCLYILDTVDNIYWVYYSLDSGATYTAVKDAAAPANTSRIANFADVTRMGIENDTYNTSSQSYVDNLSVVRINSIQVNTADGTKTID